MLEANWIIILQPTRLILRDIFILMVLWSILGDSVLIDRMGYRFSSRIRLWFLLVDVVEVVVMVRVNHSKDRVIIKVAIVEIEVMLMHERVEHKLLERLPILMIEIIVIPSQARLRSMHLIPSLQVLLLFVT